jgi:uncharacterized membrane protein YvlD (DUF360 family)
MRLNPWYLFWRRLRQYLTVVLRGALYLLVAALVVQLMRQVSSGLPRHFSAWGIGMAALLAVGIFAILPVVMWFLFQLIGRSNTKTKGTSSRADKN